MFLLTCAFGLPGWVTVKRTAMNIAVWMFCKQIFLFYLDKHQQEHLSHLISSSNSVRKASLQKSSWLLPPPRPLPRGPPVMTTPPRCPRWALSNVLSQFLWYLYSLKFYILKCVISSYISLSLLLGHFESIQLWFLQISHILQLLLNAWATSVFTLPSS